MIELDKFQGHIVLYCKGYYRAKGVDFITGLQRIWAVRCGHDVEHIDGSSLEYIANDLYRIIKKTNSPKLEYLFEIVHKELPKDYSDYEGMSAIEKLITIYKHEIWQLQIREKVKTNYRTIIKLPKPQRRLFNRIVKGWGKFEDYEKVKD